MSADINFVHGWGAAPDIWDGVIDHLPAIAAYKLDLGFMGASGSLLDNAAPALYVTHSLGTMWALKNHHHNMKGLIAINGFSCFKNFADKRTLQAMKTQLKRTPEKQMNMFWNTCGLPPADNLNVQKLEDGLEWLASWNVKEELNNLTCPVLSLAGAEDPILPCALMQEEWSGFDMRMCENAAHALPLSNPQWCAGHIKDFIREL